MSSPYDPPTEGCEWAAQRLEAWLDGDIGQHEAERVSHHLSACASCSRAASHARSIRQALRSLPMLDPPAHVLDGVLGQVREPLQRGPWRRIRGTVLAAAAIVAVTIGALAIALRPDPGVDIDRADLEARYALGVLARAGHAAGRGAGGGLALAAPGRRTNDHLEKLMEAVRTPAPKALEVHGG